MVELLQSWNSARDASGLSLDNNDRHSVACCDTLQRWLGGVIPNGDQCLHAYHLRLGNPPVTPVLLSLSLSG